MLPVRPPRVSDANPLPDSAAFTVAALRYSFGLRLVKEARPAYRPDAISVRRSSWVMPSQCFTASTLCWTSTLLCTAGPGTFTHWIACMPRTPKKDRNLRSFCDLIF